LQLFFIEVINIFQKLRHSKLIYNKLSARKFFKKFSCRYDVF